MRIYNRCKRFQFLNSYRKKQNLNIVIIIILTLTSLARIRGLTVFYVRAFAHALDNRESIGVQDFRFTFTSAELISTRLTALCLLL